MNTAADRRTAHRGRRLAAAVTAVVVTAMTLGACGTPAPARTLGDEPDLASIVIGVIPKGLRGTTADEVARLQTACHAIDVAVGKQLPDVAPEPPDVTHIGIVDAQCEWINGSSNPPPGPAELIVGIIDGGSSRLDETVSVLTDEVSVANIGDRAVYDPPTRTLYSVRSDRLWYVQLVGKAAPNTRTILTNVARALMVSSATR